MFSVFLSGLATEGFYFEIVKESLNAINLTGQVEPVILIKQDTAYSDRILLQQNVSFLLKLG